MARLKMSVISIVILIVTLVQLPLETICVFSPSFVWSAINKSLEDDRLSIVDSNNEKVRVRGCVRVVLYNHGSEHFRLNDTGSGSEEDLLWVNVTHSNFSTPDVLKNVRGRIDAINPGICVPCIVVISLVNVSSSQEEREYKALGELRNAKEVEMKEELIQAHKLAMSTQLMLLLQWKTPIQARHLIFVRLVDSKEELTKDHGKKYTRYPTRLISIWEQVLFDHFREARVIQGVVEKGDGGNKVLISGKESGIWVWMCEEIVRRLKMQDGCEEKRRTGGGEEEKERCKRDLTTGGVRMGDREKCGMYRARS